MDKAATLTATKASKANQSRCRTCTVVLAKVLHCGKCLGSHYCSKTCQQKDWPTHKSCCKKLTKDALDSWLQSYYQAEIAIQRGDFVLAESLSIASLHTAERIFHPFDMRLASPLIQLGQLMQTNGKTQEAIDYFERAYILYSRVCGSVDMHVQEITFLLINALLASENWDKAYTYAELNYDILVDFEGECTCFLIAETARQLGAIYKHFNEESKEEIMYTKALEHYDVCPDLETRARVDANYAAFGGYLGLIRSQLESLRVRQRDVDMTTLDICCGKGASAPLMVVNSKLLA